MSAATYLTGAGPWCSVITLVASTISAWVILARYRRHTEVSRRALLAIPVATAGAVLALLIILIPYLLAHPPIDDRTLAVIATTHWLWAATTATVLWAWVLASAVSTMRQRQLTQADPRTAQVTHG